MEKSRIETLIVTSKEQYIKLTAEDIIDYLKRIGVAIYPKDQITVQFHVPGGADWSGDSIEIDKEHPILVTIKSKNEERK